MIAYYALLLLWIAIFAMSVRLPEKQQKLFLSVLLGFTLFLLMGLRDRSVGSDIAHYLDVYNRNALMTNFKLEYGYQIYMTLGHKLGLSDQMFLIVTCLFIAFSFSRFFYKYSENVFLSFYLHITIGLFIITMSALRQSIAICIILYSIDFVVKRKFLWFMLVVYLASIFHFSSIVFIPAYFLYNFKLQSYKKLFGLFVILIILYFLRNIMLDLTAKFIPDQYIKLYGVYDKIKMNPLLVVIAYAIPLFIVVTWYLTGQKIEEIPLRDSFFFILTCISTVITIFSINSIIIGRLAFFFIPAYVVLIPNVMAELKLPFNKLFIYGSLMAVCLAYFVFAAVGGVLLIDKYRFFFF